MTMTADHEDVGPIEASIVFGSVTVLVTPSAVTYVLDYDYDAGHYNLAMQMASCWPHSDTQDKVIYLPDQDCLVFPRK